jgi:hypothetical protein
MSAISIPTLVAVVLLTFVTSTIDAENMTFESVAAEQALQRQIW